VIADILENFLNVVRVRIIAAIGSRCFLLPTLVVTVDRSSKKLVLLAGKELEQELLEW